MNYRWRFVTLYRRQGSRPSPWKRNAEKQNGCLGRPYCLNDADSSMTLLRFQGTPNETSSAKGQRSYHLGLSSINGFIRKIPKGIDLYFCLWASTILSWWLWLCSRAWSQASWFLQFHSSFSRLLWLFEVFLYFCTNCEIICSSSVGEKITLVAW